MRSMHRPRRLWHDPAGGSRTPAEVWLDAAEAAFGEGIREMCCRTNPRSTSFETAAATLQPTVHVEISAETLCRSWSRRRVSDAAAAACNTMY